MPSLPRDDNHYKRDSPNRRCNFIINDNYGVQRNPKSILFRSTKYLRVVLPQAIPAVCFGISSVYDERHRETPLPLLLRRAEEGLPQGTTW